MKINKIYLPFLLACFLAVSSGAKAIIVTYAESPDSLTTSLSGASVENFDSLSLGVSNNVNWQGVGTFNQLYIKNADQYGGAVDAGHPYGSRYEVQGEGTIVTSTTLTLSKPSAYFGMDWEAGDKSNVLEFYNNNTLVGEFTTSSLMNKLPSSYNGNPRDRGLDSNEPFGFINFFADPGTDFNKIVFTNNSSSGFEADNFTVRDHPYNPATDGALPGVPVAIVEGTKSVAVTPQSLASLGGWAAVSQSLGGPPGAPAPPVALLAAFGLVALARGQRGNRTAQAR